MNWFLRYFAAALAKFGRLVGAVQGWRPVWFQLQPGEGVQYQSFGRYSARTDDPQFILKASRRVPPGIYEISATTRAEGERALDSRLYFDTGQGFCEQNTLSLRSYSSENSRGIARLNSPLRALRFDPIPDEGDFVVQDVNMVRLGRFDLAARLIRTLKGARLKALLRMLVRGPSYAIELIAQEEGGHSVDEYASWISRFETSKERDPKWISAYLASKAPAAGLPKISIVMPAYNSNTQWLDLAINSVRQQAYSNWELIIVDDCSPDDRVQQAVAQHQKEDPRIVFHRRAVNGGIAAATNDALERVTGSWIAFLDHDDQLTSDALALIVANIFANPMWQILYTDEDKIDEVGRRSEPYFKGKWNRELFYRQNYLNHLTVVRADIVEAVGRCRIAFDGSQDYDMLLRCIERVPDEAIGHVPFVCYHWRFGSARTNFSMTQSGRSLNAARLALEEHFQRLGQPAEVFPAWGDSPYHRVERGLPEKLPLVSLIIPTRNQVRLLKPCIESIIALADYEALEILVVDNDSDDPETLAYMQEIEDRGVAKIVRAPGPFNYSAINNRAAEVARGEIIGLVNNDIEVISNGWLKAMVRCLSRKDVGAVGARLLYADGRVQHGGVVLGIGGVAGHFGKLARRTDVGPFGQLRLARESSAVTAACMLVRREVFEQVGGLDEHGLRVAFNDVDLCLKIRAAGHRIVWTPQAELFHYESVSRGTDLVGEKLARFAQEVETMKQRWGKELGVDPYYSPNLTLATEQGGLAYPPRCARPWAEEA